MQQPLHPHQPLKQLQTPPHLLLPSQGVQPPLLLHHLVLHPQVLPPKVPQTPHLQSPVEPPVRVMPKKIRGQGAPTPMLWMCPV